MPIISVVMSTYNTPEEYLCQSIESVLQQSEKNFEFIIIDDGSLNGDADIVRKYTDSRIHLIVNEENLGLAKSLNRGLEFASGKYIFRMDSDDIALPNRFEIQLQFMEKHPDVDILGARAMCFGSKTGPAILDYGNDAYVKSVLFMSDLLLHPTIVMRKESLDRYGLKYNPELRRAQDYDLWVRASEVCKIEIIPDIVLKYRCHDQQATVVARQKQLEVCRMVLVCYLNRLSLPIDDNSIEMRNALSGYSETPIKLDDIVSWIQTVLRANNGKEIFNKYYFREKLVSRWMIAAVKLWKNKKLMISTGALFQTFSPVNLMLFGTHVCRNRRFIRTYKKYLKKEW